MKQLLVITLTRVNGQELSELRKLFKLDRQCISTLPKYCIRNNNGKITYTDYYLQFVDEFADPNNYYYIFDVEHADIDLEYLIDECGLDDLVEDYDYFNLIKNITPNTFTELKMGSPDETHLVFDVQYHGSGEDFEVDVIPFGYLDADFNLCEI